MFQGFTQETSDFLWELSFNNERPWFLEHKEQYEHSLNLPFKALYEDTLACMQKQFPDREWQGHASRIYRDARRLFGRGPYKDHLWFVIGEGSRHSGAPAFWFEISAATWECGVGFFEVTPATMEIFRRMIDANPARFERLFGETARMRGLRILGPEYKRAKGNYDKPIADWYNRRYLAAEWVHDFGGDALTAELPEKLAKAYARLMPLYDFFCEVYRAAAESGEEKR